MNSNLKFKTKQGYCHFLEDQLVFTKNEVLKETDIVKSKNKALMRQIIYGGGFLLFLNIIFRNVMDLEYPSIYAVFMLGVFLYGFIKAFQLDAKLLIKMDAIKQLDFYFAKQGIRKPYFNLSFKDRFGQDQVYKIILPVSKAALDENIEQALDAFNQANINVKKHI